MDYESPPSSAEQQKHTPEPIYMPSSPVAPQALPAGLKPDIDNIQTPLLDLPNPMGDSKGLLSSTEEEGWEGSSLMTTMQSLSKKLERLQDLPSIGDSLLPKEHTPGPIYRPPAPSTPQVISKEWKFDVDDAQMLLQGLINSAGDLESLLSPTEEEETPKPSPMAVLRDMIEGFERLQNLSKKLESLQLSSSDKQEHATVPILMPPSSVAPRVLFEKLELGVDDIEAPIPDPFNYVEELAREEKYPGGDILEVEKHEEGLRQILGVKREVKIQKGISRNIGLGEDQAADAREYAWEQEFRGANLLPTLHETVLEMQQGDTSRAAHLHDLACQSDSRYHKTGAIEDLQQAILYTKEALAATPPNHPSRISCLGSLANYLSLRYGRTGSIDDLQKSIVYGKEALVTAPLDHPDRVRCLSNLANYLGLRYDRTGTMSDLRQAIVYSKKALEKTPQNCRSRVACLNNLAGRLGSRYDKTGTMDDLQQSIIYFQEALVVEALVSTPQRYAYRANLLGNLAYRFGIRYDRTGAIDDLQQAIVCNKEALGRIPQSHPSWAAILGGLAGMLKSRYGRTGAMEDLQQSIMYGQRALEATPQDHPGRAGRLHNLSTRLSARYDRVGTKDDLQQAIMYGKEALALIPHDHPDRLYCLNSLATILGSEEGPMDDLQQAIGYCKEALEMTPKDHPDRAGRLNNLAAKLNLRYDRTGAISDLQQAIVYGKEALALMPSDHPNRAESLLQLAITLSRNAELTKNTEDLDNCFRYWKECWDCNNSQPSTRISAATLFSLMVSSLQLWEQIDLPGRPSPTVSSSLLKESHSLLEGAILLLPKISQRSLERRDQQYNLLSFGKLATNAASSALSTGKSAYDALKLLELSRGIIMSFAIDCRSDLSDLKRTHSKLFEKFDDLRIEIDTPLPDKNNDLVDIPFSANHIRDQIRQRREDAIKEMEEITKEVRNLPGYEEFLLPPSPKELMSLARDGPIVVFTSNVTRSDAIIVTSSDIISIPLPKLYPYEIPERLGGIASLTEGKLRTYSSRNKRMQELLFWLWDVAVKPVIQKLQLKPESAEGPGTDLVHIWWIGAGLLNTAPFHAAGDYSKDSDPAENVLSYAVSSYTPTIKALSYAREKDFTVARSREQKPSTQLLLVTMSKTPGERDLPNVGDEVASIVDATKGAISAEHLEKPSAKDILSRLQLESYHAIHFACHGISNEKDPSNSHLVLLKDSGDTTVAAKLTVQDISRKKTKTAQLAYLSACSTADNPAKNLADEVIHIASGFQLAGFSHVLAAMWPSESKVCKEISIDFYRSLFNSSDGNSDGNSDGSDSGSSGKGHRRVRIAFHEAVKKAQQKHRHSPLRWAPFVHLGA